MSKYFLGLICTMVLGLGLATPMPASAAPSAQNWVCPKGNFLVGFAGKVGAWIDNFHPVCARWNSTSKTLDAPTNGDTFGYTNGGSPMRAVCGPNEAAIGWDDGQTIQADHSVHVQNLYLTCANVATLEVVGSDRPSMLSDNGDRIEKRYCHDATKLGNGIEVDFGGQNDIAQIGILCEKADTVKAAARIHFPHDAGIAGAATGTTSSSSSGTHIHLPHAGAGIVTPTTTPAPPPVAGSAVVAGDWKTSEGAMTLEQDGNRLTGSYSQDSGRIKAKREGAVWTGIWSEGHSDQRCMKEKLGTYYWGSMTFLFSNQNRHFDGVWSYCKDDPFGGKSWSGDRVK